MTTLDARRATQLDDARRTTRWKAHAVLNPDERMIWSGYCESKVGQQSKAGTGDATGVILAVLIFIVTVVGIGALLNEVFGISFGFVFGLLIAVVVLWKVAPNLETGRDSTMYCRQRTIYALTDERVLVFRNCNSGVPVRSVPLRFIDRIRVTGVRADDRGTVEFLSWNPFTGTWTIPLRFFMVKDPKQVMDRVEAAVTDRE